MNLVVSINRANLIKFVSDQCLTLNFLTCHWRRCSGWP